MSQIRCRRCGRVKSLCACSTATDNVQLTPSEERSLDKLGKKDEFKFGFTGFKTLPEVHCDPFDLAGTKLTIRDHFAIAALQGLMAANWKDCPYPTGYAEEAYKMADCMLKARSA